MLFINTPGWKTQITERTAFQVIMLKYAQNGKLVKKLTFRISYSIIPSALRNFESMFNLDVHKEVLANRLYTEENIHKAVLKRELWQR